MLFGNFLHWDLNENNWWIAMGFLLVWWMVNEGVGIGKYERIIHMRLDFIVLEVKVEKMI